MATPESSVTDAGVNVSEIVEMKRLFISMSKMVDKLTGLLLLSLLLSLVLAVGAFYLWWRTPEVITWKEGADGKVLLAVNNRSYGEISSLSMSRQSETPAEKMFAAKELTRTLYAVNPETRQAALERVLNWFRDDSARSRDLFAKALKEVATDPNSCVAINLEKTQGWQSTFTVQETNTATDNPNLIRIVGTQRLRRTLLSPNTENRLLQAEIEMTKDSGLREENVMTGFVPTFIQCKVLQTSIENTSNAAGTSAAQPAPQLQQPQLQSGGASANSNNSATPNFGNNADNADRTAGERSTSVNSQGNNLPNNR